MTIKKENERFYDIKEIVYKLYKKGEKNKDIERILEMQGYHINSTQLSSLIKQILLEKGEEASYRSWSYLRKITEVDDKVVFELYRIGMPYNEIVKLYEMQGIHVSESLIRRRINSYCEREKQGFKPNYGKSGRLKAEEFFKLQSNGFSIKEIDEMIKKKGKKNGYKDSKKLNNNGVNNNGAVLSEDPMKEFKERINARIQEKGYNFKVFGGTDRTLPRVPSTNNNQDNNREIEF